MSRSTNQAYESCGISIYEYDSDFLRKHLPQSAKAKLRQGLETIQGSKVAILAPGFMAKYVLEILPDTPVLSTGEFSDAYERYVVCCSPFTYFEVMQSLKGETVDPGRFLFPYTTEALEDARAIHDGIDMGRWSELLHKHAGRHTASNASTKYFDIEIYLSEAIRRCWKARLHCARPMTLLDIGAGSCLFQYICSHYGHEAYGLDRDREKIEPHYLDMSEFFGATVFYSDIDTPFRGFGTSGFELDVDRQKKIQAPKRLSQRQQGRVRFDCYTAFATRFSEGWNRIDYQYFLNSLRVSAGKDGAFLYAQPNASSMMADEVFPALRNVGAEILEFEVKYGFVRFLHVHLAK